MCIGADEGCQVVPDPIAPMDIKFVSLEPTRMPMSLSVITINGPMFIEPIPGMFFMLGIFPIAPGEGLAPGIGMFIPIFCGDAPGDAAGIGMFISIFCCGGACEFGDAARICMPGMFICWGEAFDEGVR